MGDMGYLSSDFLFRRTPAITRHAREMLIFKTAVRMLGVHGFVRRYLFSIHCIVDDSLDYASINLSAPE